MATNYTFSQVCKIINNGTDTEALVDIGRRFPLLLHKVTRVSAVAGDAFVDLMDFVPDYVTANKMNAAMKAGASGETEADETTDAETPAPKAAKSTKPAAPADEDEDESADGIPDYEKMKNKELKAALEAAGAPVPKSLKRCDLLAACKAMHETPTAESDDEDEDDTDEAEEQAANPYEGQTAPELFKLCKKRGIKAAPKKPAKFYVDLLTKADAEAAQADTENDDDDWSEDEAEVEEAPKTTGKKTGKKAEKAGKPAKKAAKNDDEDDDWDI